VITASTAKWDARFFRFQLIIGGTLIGDASDSIVYSGVQDLRRLSMSTDPRLSRTGFDGAAILALAIGDKVLHDRLIHQWTDSLDQWSVAAYTTEDMAVWIAQGIDGRGNLDGPVMATQVPISAYEDIVTAVETYFREHSTS
jgi:hypothetical protein